tara:strand:+ start:5198 stop:6352 length:1155 start_codon:yes stop_codon:yes gene_type:complete
MKPQGQYFTTDRSLQAKVRQFVRDPIGDILEPAAGEGHLVSVLNVAFPDNTVVAYELDRKLVFPDRRVEDYWYNEDFLEAHAKEFNTIVANPPFVKTKKGNLYVMFIRKCWNLLSCDGQMIFIVPSDFFKLTQAAELLSQMCLMGSFTDIYWPHNEKLFRGASIDVVVFRYQKGLMSDKTLLNEKEHNIVCSNGVVTFLSVTEQYSTNVLLGALCTVHVGLVTGKESVFKSCMGNISLLLGEENREKYILVSDIKSEKNVQITEYLEQHKHVLMTRKIRKFTEDNWFQWGALRNYKTMTEKAGIDCLYVKSLTRAKQVCFKGKVELYGGGLLMILPKKEIDIDALASYLNSNDLRQRFTHSGRFKIGQRHLSSLLVPPSVLKNR